MLTRRGLLLRRLEMAMHRDGVDRVLEVLADGIRAACDFIKMAEADGPGDYAQAVADDECDMIEALLGSAFVVCQKYITGVVARALALDRADNAPPPPGRSTKVQVMRLGSPIVAGTSWSEIECLDAVANYFKHEDEWRGDWNDPSVLQSPLAQRTATVVVSMGLQPYSTGNLRTAAERLGNGSYADLSVFGDMLGRWCASVVAAARTEKATPPGQ